MPRSLKKFFLTPKGMLTIILAILAAMAAPGEGLRAVLPGLVSAALAAGIVDMLVLRARNKAWEFPSGAVLTAMIVAMVLRAQEPWYVTALTSVVAILSKYIFRSRTANVFNPAALAILISFYVFHTGQSWWGALTEVTPVAQPVLVIAGVFITSRVNKMPLVLAFLGTYFLLFTITAFVSDPRWVSEIFRPPDLEAALFFAFIILTDPPTSPAKYPDQIVCGMVVAVVSFAFFEWAGVVYYLLAGVLAGNLWEAWRRANRRTGHTFPKGLGTFLREITPWRRPLPAPRSAAAIVVMGLAALIPVLQPQSRPATLTFDVASIRPSGPDSQGLRFETTPDNGLRATGVTLKFLVRKAWDVEDFQIAGGPGWAGTARFDVLARPENPDKTDFDQSSTGAVEQFRAERLRARIRTLLAARFQLSVRQELKTGTVYFLEQAKNGQKLNPVTGSRGIGRNRGLITAENASVAMLARTLSATLLTPVLDRSGLIGNYAFRLQWAEAGAPGEPEEWGVSLFTAIEEQLGLRLRSGKGPVPLIRIERAEKPSPN